MGNFFSNLFRSGDKDIDPRVFKHPLALQTKWTRLKRGGLNFRSHAMRQIDNGNLVFMPTWKSYVLGGILLVLLLFSLSIPLFSGHLEWPVILISLLACVLVYVVLVRQMFQRATFDFLNGVYWKGIREPAHLTDVSAKKNMAYTNDIGAVQIIRERVSSRNGSYHSYELNLVLKNGDRLNAIDHSNKEAIWKEASQLAKQLGVPLWDTTRRMRSTS